MIVISYGEVNVRREVIKGTINKGSIGLFEFSEFSTSLKLTLIKKQIDQKLTHKWRNIFVNNLKFTTKIEILASKKFRIVSDILSCYREWKISVVTARVGCGSSGSNVVNFIVCPYHKITEIGSRIWNKKLISRGVVV